MGLDYSAHIHGSSAASVSVSWTKLRICGVNGKSFCICFVAEVFALFTRLMVHLGTLAVAALSFVD